MFSSNASQVSTAANYIEDVFSTYLYTAANQVAQTITNGINLSEKGGLVWIKTRSAAYEHFLADTVRGAANYLQSQSTAAQINNSTELTSFNSNGFSIGTDSSGIINFGSTTLVSWTFRKQAKFFDVVTYTGTGAAQTISHNLGSIPGCMIVKRTSGTSDWYVYHRSLDPGGNPATAYLSLNLANAANSTLAWTNTQPTSTSFFVGDGVGQNPINQNGATYVAYLFAHNAGGFGASGTDNVISCGSYTTDASGNATVSLGYEPQWILWKNSQGAYGWFLLDNMRGIATGGDDARLIANTSGAEASVAVCSLTSTGFMAEGQVGSATYIYIAIRRGPMKTPTSGTSVFSPIAAANGTTTQNTTDFPVDLQLSKLRNTAGEGPYAIDRLRGVSTNTTGNNTRNLVTSSTGAEGTDTNTLSLFWNNTGFQTPNYYGGSDPAIYWNFRRAPGFFDVVCYTGTGGNTTVNHNLGVAPELLIIKGRSLGGYNWITYWASSPPAFNGLTLNTNQGPFDLSSAFNNTYPTSSTFSLANVASINNSGSTYVAYLFATCPGVSKVGTYTGTAALQTINCGFTSGARFVLIKRTDSTGDWYVWDSARGISSGNDPYLLINSTAAEVTGTNYVDTTSVGFQVTAAAPAGINASGGSYIFLAIA